LVARLPGGAHLADSQQSIRHLVLALLRNEPVPRPGERCAVTWQAAPRAIGFLHLRLLLVRDLKEHVRMAGLTDLAEAGEVLAAQVCAHFID
jgi:hypothetical protein